jgi:hypothetical protein
MYFKTKTVRIDKGHYNAQGFIQKEDIMLTNLFAPNVGTLSSKTNTIRSKGREAPIQKGNFNNLLSQIDK